MPAQILEFRSSTPGSTNGSLNRPIPASPDGIVLALLGFSLSMDNPVNRVVLDATIGIQSTLGTPQILFQIFRGDLVVASTLVSTLAVMESKNVSFTAVDTNVPTGVVLPYQIVARTVTAAPLLNTATVTGPVTLTATAYKVF